MRHLFGLLLLSVLFLGMSSFSYAVQDPRNDDHEKLRALKDRVAEAFNKRDANAIAACFTKDFSVTTIDQTPLDSAAGIERYLDRMFKAPGSLVTDLKVAPEPAILTKFIDADNGYCYGKNHEIYTMRGGMVVPMESQWTATVHRENGEWKITAIHAGVNFLDNPLLARTKAQNKMMAAGGFAAGVVATSLCGAIYLRRARKKD